MPITLNVSGPREVLTEEKATATVAAWKEELLAHRAAEPSASILCDKIILTDKSYTSGAAKIVSTFLTSTDDFQPSIASGISIAILSDTIASRMEEEGLEVLTTISNAFKESKLVEVDLSDNAMGTKGIDACSTVLGGDANVTANLAKLSLCNNGLSESTMHEVADLLTKGGDNCIAKNLTQIHFYNNMSGPKGCEAFESIMEKCTENKLTDIRFSSTRARAGGSTHITTALKSLAESGNLEHVTRLDLADNTFSDESVNTDLATALKSCSKLTYINLRDCCIANEGMKRVCNALKVSGAKLTHLDVSGNDLTASGARSVAKLVASLNSTIVEFSAEENEMTSRGVKKIVDVINSQTLEKIVMNQNEFGDIAGRAILDMVSENRVPNLTRIELNEGSFTEDVVGELVECFGDKLPEMDDNDEDTEHDADLDDEEEESEDEDDATETADRDVDDLAGALSQVQV